MVENSVSTTKNNFAPSAPSNSVSVIVAVYNGEKFIAETLNSILGQTTPPAEVIVVDDGSRDHTAQIVDGFGDSVSLITTSNHGVCAARNTGAARAKGNWLAFCDADDLWLPTKIEKQLRLANEATDIHYVLTDYTEVTNDVVSEKSHLSFAPKDYWTLEKHEAGFVVREPITGKLTTFQPSITSTPIVKREFYDRVGGFDVKADKWTEDTCFHFRCLSVVPFGVVPEVLMHYRRHADSVSAATLNQLRHTVVIWKYIIANYPQAQPCRAELLKGLVAMRKEIAECARYRRRQKLKRLLGLN
jgi:glycosyltransferase involved in cell wall biosynthesis